MKCAEIFWIMYSGHKRNLMGSPSIQQQKDICKRYENDSKASISKKRGVTICRWCPVFAIFILFFPSAPFAFHLSFAVPATPRISSVLPRSHRKPECQAKGSGRWPRSDAVEWRCCWSAFFFGSNTPSVRSVSFKLLVVLLLSIHRRHWAFHHTISNFVTSVLFPSFPFRGSNRRSSIGSVATLPQNLRFGQIAGAEVFSCWEYPKLSLVCFANNTFAPGFSTRYFQKRHWIVNNCVVRYRDVHNRKKWYSMTKLNEVWLHAKPVDCNVCME